MFEGRPSNKTLVLASVDGSTLGEVGTARLADELGDPELVDAVIVISGLGARPTGESPIVRLVRTTRERAGSGSQRTARGVAAPGARPVGRRGRARSASWRGSASRSASAPRACCSSAASTPCGSRAAASCPAAGGELEDVDEDRLGALGRATLRTVTALDQGRAPEHGPESYVTAVSQVMPGWVLALLSLTPDPARRWSARSTPSPARGAAKEPVAPLAALAGRPGAAVRGRPGARRAARAGGRHPGAARRRPWRRTSTRSTSPALLVLAAVVGRGRGALGRGRASWPSGPTRRSRTPPRPGRRARSASSLSVTALLLWIVNPFAALLLVPAAAPLDAGHARRSRARRAARAWCSWRRACCCRALVGSTTC